jgi:formylglycine-generating enzyme required for sulfatase activity
MKLALSIGLSSLALGPWAMAQEEPLSITSLSMLSANPQLVIQSPSGITNQIQFKTNLSQVDWQILTNLFVTQSPYAFVDAVAPISQCRFYRVAASSGASTGSAPVNMVLIPAGAFTMGDNLDGENDATPTVKVTVSAFFMETNLVSYSEWQLVYNWGTNHGFSFVNAGAGKAANHPVQMVDWFDAVKWCNARSELANVVPAYYTDAKLTQVYTTGEVSPYVNWEANGYRLPTEAEWEKAARGGLSGQRFPWGSIISESLADYYGDTSHNYDLGPNGYNAAFTNGVTPYTSPVGYFAPNAYGLYDMAGNVSEWCWDWYVKPYAGGSDPRGPASANWRILRGGSWTNDVPINTPCAHRSAHTPSLAFDYLGLRCVRSH